MKRYRWNKVVFFRNMVKLITLMILSLIIVKGVLWGLDKEYEIQSEQTKVYLEKIHNEN